MVRYAVAVYIGRGRAASVCARDGGGTVLQAAVGMCTFIVRRL